MYTNKLTAKRSFRNTLLVFLVGVTIAVSAFLITFLTTNKAQEKSEYTNLNIPLPTIPLRSSVEPISPKVHEFQIPSPVLTASPEATEDSEPVINPNE